MVAQSSDALSLALSLAPDRSAPLADWLRWLEAGRGEQIDLGLERCAEVAARLGLGKPAPTVVTVAGTNGKGSSVALLGSIWRSAGYRVGAYTSPHLLRYNERVRIDGAEIGDAVICAAFEQVERARRDVPLTYFEFGTLAALTIFEQAALDIVILEVGLGGRLDAVNIIDPDVALIAAIGLDHESWLGTSREQIAIEKAGIMRAGGTAVCSDNEVPHTLFDCATTLGADMAVLGVDYAFEDNGVGWTWWSGATVLADLPRPALIGAHQLRNAAGVLKVVQRLQHRHAVSEAQIRSGLIGVVLLGRFHRVSGTFEYVMDVAHNPQAAEIFTATLAAMPAAPRTHALIGMLNTKNHVEFLRPLAPRVDSWHFATLPGATGARAEDLGRSLRQVAPKASWAAHATVADAHAAVLNGARPGDRILVVGSFLTVGAMLKLLEAAPDAFA